MNKMSHVIERKEFIQNEELKNRYRKDGQNSINGNTYQIHNILTREDFVKDEDLKNRYSEGLPVLEKSQEVKLLGKDERVMGFEEYMKSKNSKSI